MKRILSLLLSVLMLFSLCTCITASAAAAEPEVTELLFGKTYTNGYSKNDYFENGAYWDYYSVSIPADGKFTFAVNSSNKDYFNAEKAGVILIDVNDENNAWVSDENGTLPTKASDSIDAGVYLLAFAYQDTALTGTFTFKFDYTPTVKNTSLSKLTSGKKAFTAKWKTASGVTGYQLQYSTDKKFKKNVKIVKVKNSKTAKKTVKKLKSGKKYYVRIRTYKTVVYNGKNKTFNGKWSKSKSVKVK